MNIECCQKTKGGEDLRRKTRVHKCQMFQTGCEKGHWDWLSDLLVALSRVVGQKSQTAVFQKEIGREGSVSLITTIFPRIALVKGSKGLE